MKDNVINFDIDIKLRIDEITLRSCLNLLTLYCRDNQLTIEMNENNELILVPKGENEDGE